MNTKSLPVHLASFAGALGTVRYLLEMQPEHVSATDQDGQLPLHCAARLGHLETVRYLLDVCPVHIAAKNKVGMYPCWHWIDVSAFKCVVPCVCSCVRVFVCV
eukprot:scpid88128/ scgid0660/ Espin; Autosomal recessive deafness type 36 protein; Ectoplasmic specialization protein